jgi:hypothetical protein
MKEKPKLKLTFRAFCKFEEIKGESLFSAFGISDATDDTVQGIDFASFKFNDFALIYWIARIHDKPDMTQDDAFDEMEILDIGFQEVLELVSAALIESMAKDDDANEQGDQKTTGKK